MSSLPVVNDGCPYPVWWIATQSTFALIYFTITCHAIYIFYQFIKHKKSETSSKFSLKLAFTIIISSIIVFISWTILSISSIFCNQVFALYYIIIAGIMLLSYITQWYTLLILFYERLHFIFNPTMYALSNCTTRFYKTMFILLPIAFIITSCLYVILSNKYFWLWSIIGSMVVLFVLILMISMVILFIYKLIYVYRDTVANVSNNDTVDNEVIIGAITKLTILNSISTVITLIVLGCFVYGINTGLRSNPVFHIFYVLMSILEYYSNFLSAIMCYKKYEGYYKYLCKYMDNNCRICWRKIVNIDGNNARNLENVVGEVRVPTMGLETGMSSVSVSSDNTVGPIEEL